MSTGLLADIQQRVARPPSPAPAPTGGLLADIQTRARTTPLTDVQRAGIEAELGQWRARGQRGVLVRAQALAPSARDYLYRALHASGAERRAATGQYTTGSGLHLGKPPAGAAETGFWRALEHVPPEHQAAVAPLLMEAFQPLTSRGPRVAAQTGPYVTKLQPPEFDPRAARTLQDMPPEYRASSAAMTAWLQDPDAVRPLEERHPGFLAGTTTLEPTARAAKFQKRLTRFVQAALYADQRERARRQGGNVATQMLSEADEMLANLVKVAPEAVKLFSGNLPRGGAARQYINARQRGDIIAQSEYRKRFTPLDELVLQAHALQASKNAAERIVGVAAHEPIRQLLAREESPAIVGAVEYMDKFLLGIPSYLKGEPLVPAVTPAQQAAAGGAYFAALMTSPLWRPFYAPGRMAVAAIGRKLGLAAGKLSLPATTAFFRFAETRVGAHLLNAMANVPKAIGGIAGAQLLGPLTAAERKRIEGGGDFGGILRARIGRAVKTMREPSPQLLVLAFAIGLARPMQIRPETYERLGVLETNRAQALALMKMWPGVSERWMLNFVKGWKRAAKEAGRPLTGRTRIAGPGADFRELMFRTFPTRPADAILVMRQLAENRGMGERAAVIDGLRKAVGHRMSTEQAEAIYEGFHAQLGFQPIVPAAPAAPGAAGPVAPRYPAPAAPPRESPIIPAPPVQEAPMEPPAASETPEEIESQIAELREEQAQAEAGGDAETAMAMQRAIWQLEEQAESMTAQAEQEVPGDREAEGRLPRGEPQGQEPGRPVQEPGAGAEAPDTGGVLQAPEVGEKAKAPAKPAELKKPAAKAKGAVVEGYLEGADRDYYKRTSWLGEGEDVEQALAAAREKGMLPERITVDGKTLIVSEALRQQLHRRDPTLPASVLRKRLEADLRKQFGAPEPTEQPVHEAAESPEGHRLLEVSDPEGQVIGQIDVATAQETAADPAGNLRRILNKAAGREAITPGETMLRVHGLTVNKTSRRQGIGRRLVLQAAKDVSPGWLWSSQLGFPGQRAAVKLFEALEEAGEIEMLWGPGTHGNAVWAARIAQVAARPVSAYTARKVAAALKRKAITPEQAARIEEADRVAHHYGLDWRPLIFGTERVAFDPAAAEADTAQGRILREHIAAGLGFDYKTEEGRRATDERIRHAREKGTEFVLHGVTLPHRAGRGGPGDRAYSGLFASQGDATAGHEVGHGLWQAGYRAEAAPATEEAFAEWFAAEVVAGRLPQLTRGEGQGTAAPGLEMVEQPIQPGDIARFIHRNLPSLAGEDIPAGQTAPLKAFRKKFRDYLAGAKDVVATGEELVKYAEQRLPRGSRLPTGDVLRLAKRIARARTTGPAASPKMNRPIRQAVALIHYLADKADRLEALGETRKLLTKISKRAKGRPRKRGLQRELAPAVADVLGMLPQNQRVSTLAARVRRIADEMGLLQEVSETQQLGIDWQDPLVAPTAKAIVGNLASKLAELREPPERMADLPGNAVREINAALAQLLRLSETQKMLHLMDARLEKGTLLQDAVTVVLANRTSLPEHRRKAGREIARELLALKPLNLPRLIEKLTQGRRDTVLYDIGVYDPVDGLNQYARLLLDADDGLVAGIPAEGLDLDKVFSGWRRHWGYSRSGRPPKSSILPVAVKGAYRTENRADPRTGKVRLGLRVPVATLELSRAEWATVYAMTLDPHVSDELHRGSHAGIHLPRWNVGPVKIPNAEFNQIIEALPEDIRQMGRAYSRVFNGELGKAAIARGIELGDRGEPRGFAAGDTYTPTERYKEQVRSITPQQMLQPRAPRTLTNQPHLHERVQKSDAAYEIRPIHEVYSRWAEQMAAYAGLEKPARNLAWLLQQEDFRNAIKQSFPNGRQIVRYLIQRTQYFRHTLDLGEPSVMTRIVTWPLRMSVRAALPLRLRIGGYQFLSILNTIARDGLKSAATGVARMAAHGSQVRAQIAEEAPLLELRRRQTGARAISPLMISKAGRQRATGRRSKLDTFMWGLIRSVDIATTGSTYAAARQRHSGTERKAILSAIIDTGMTQPMWDPVFINGFGMMAHNSFWDAIMSRFQTQKWQNYGTFLGKFNALAGAQRDLRRAEAEGDAERVKIARQRVAAATRDLVKALFLIGVLGAVGLATIAAIDRKIAGTAHQPIQTIIGETALRRMLQNAGVPGEAVGFLVDVWRRGAKGRPLEAFGQTAKDVRLLVDMVADMVKAGDEVIKTGRNAGRTRAEVAVRAFLLRGAPLLARVFGIPLDAAKQYATRLLELIDRPSDLHFGQRLNGLTGKRPDKLSDEYQQRLWEELQRWGVSYKQAKQHLCKRLKIRALSARRSSRLRRFWKAMGGDLGE